MGRLLVRGRWPLLLFAVAATVVAWPSARRLQLSRSLLTSVAEGTEHQEPYARSRRIFGPHEEVVVGYAEPQLFEAGGVKVASEAKEKIEALAGRLTAVDGVQNESVYHIGKALKFRFRAKRLVGLLEGFLIGPQHETVAILMQLEPQDESSTTRAKTIAELRRIARNHTPRAYVAGEPITVNDSYRYLDEDGRLLFRVSLGLLGLVSLVLFRGLRWLLLPVAVVAAAIVWTRAILALLGLQLTMVSAMLNSLVTVIAVATVMHVIVGFGERFRNRGERGDAFRDTVADIGPPVFWTCLTTAAGFAALFSSSIHPIRSFAVMMTLGALLVLPASALLLPGGILIGRKETVPGSAPGQGRLLQFLSRLADWVERRPWWIGTGALLLSAAAGAGLVRLDVESDPTKYFRESSPLVEGLEFIEQRLGGTGQWEVNFPAPPELTSDYLNRVRRLADELREISDDEHSGLTNASALSDWLDLIPEVPLVLNSLDDRLRLLQGVQSGMLAKFYNSDAGRMRILLRSRQRMPTDEKLMLIQRVRTLARQEFPQSETTGVYVLLAYAVQNLMRDQLVSFALATAGIVLMIAVAFRSILLGMAALIPNLFPILLVVGTMGWIDMPVNMGTAMIAAVSMGLTVDGTIHYIAGYRRARRAGLDHRSALRETHQGTGRALLFAALALVIGFSVLNLSHFLPLMQFGLLTSVSIAGGLAADLLLLPVLLRFAE